MREETEKEDIEEKVGETGEEDIEEGEVEDESSPFLSSKLTDERSIGGGRLWKMCTRICSMEE